jgi:multidrug efflux pump subunit AcrA (membrane-fusion protein)
MKARHVAVVVVALVVVAGAGLVMGVPAVTSTTESVPTVRPERGDLDVRIHARGEIAPHQSMALSAPAVGTTLQLVRLAPAGTLVAQGDVVMAFDPEGQLEALAQARSALAEAEQEILKLRADARVLAAEDEVALTQARFDVRLAETKVVGNEFVGAIEARKNELALQEARQKVAQLEQDVRTHAAGNEAALAALVEKRRKAELSIGLAERHIDSMTVRAPIAGMVTISQNQAAMGNFGFQGMTVPDFREGDTVQPGSPVAAIVDLSAIEVNARLDESARTALSEGARASIHVDALAGAPLPARAKRLGGISASRFWWDAAAREFDAIFSIEQPTAALRPGMSATVVASADPIRAALHVPRQALFDKDGKSIVYVRRGGEFVPLEVKVLRLTESRAVLEGVSIDQEVALADPARTAQPGSGGRRAPMPSARVN